MNSLSDSDEDSCYELTNPIMKLQRKIVENISVYNYLKICINIGWIVDSHLLEDATLTEKITLAVLILDSIHILRQMRDIHFSMMESLYCLADNPDKLKRLRKKIGYFEWIISFIW